MGKYLLMFDPSPLIFYFGVSTGSYSSPDTSKAIEANFLAFLNLSTSIPLNPIQNKWRVSLWQSGYNGSIGILCLSCAFIKAQPNNNFPE